VGRIGINTNPAVRRSPTAVVFAPAPWLETVIDGPVASPEIHLHPAGQGFWVSRLLASLGVEVTMCSSFGGEPGTVIKALVDQLSIHVEGVTTANANGSYIDDRRGGERVELARMVPLALTRHEIDDL
jgi:1-phosphofructokinase